MEKQSLVGNVHYMKLSTEKDSKFCIMIHKENGIKRDSQIKEVGVAFLCHMMMNYK